jgi:hypothetical protein
MRATIPAILVLAFGCAAAEGPIEVPPARLGCARHVAEDSPKLWGWLFPPGFRAPRLMDLARRRSWTIKPAIADPAAIP